MKSAYNQMGTTGGGTSLFSSGNDHDTAQKSQGEIRLLKGDRAPLETFPGQHPQAFPPRKGSVPELNHGVGTVGDGQCLCPISGLPSSQDRTTRSAQPFTQAPTTCCILNRISVCRVLLSASPHPFSLQPVSLLENAVTLLVSQQTLWQVTSISVLNKLGLGEQQRMGSREQMNGDISLGG